ncbi:MAG: hypothetical protein ORN29_00540, partial [Rhodoferax sp.]|nr:hypothetical protein [Rhodoferax sp.]
LRTALAGVDGVGVFGGGFRLVAIGHGGLLLQKFKLWNDQTPVVRGFGDGAQCEGAVDCGSG